MRRVGSLLLLAGLVAAFSSAPVGAAGFSIYGAYWSPEDGDETYGLGLRFSADLSNHWIFDVGASTYGDSEQILAAGPSAIDFTAFDAGLRYRWQNEKVHPYLGAGGTFAKLVSELGELDDEGGLYALLGADFGDSEGPKLFVEAIYRVIDGRVKSFPPGGRLVEDIELGGLGVNLGVTWRW